MATVAKGKRLTKRELREIRTLRDVTPAELKRLGLRPAEEIAAGVKPRKPGLKRRHPRAKMEGPTKPSTEPDVAARPQSKGNTHTYSGRLGAAVRKRREELGVSVEAFKDSLAVQDVAVTIHTVYHWEKGLRPIPLNALPAIAKILKLAIRDLLPAK